MFRKPEYTDNTEKEFFNEIPEKNADLSSEHKDEIKDATTQKIEVPDRQTIAVELTKMLKNDVKKNPFKAISIATIIGLLIGLIIGRS